MNRLHAIAACLNSFAKFEEQMHPRRMGPEHGIPLLPCEGCRRPLKGGGLCWDCLRLAAQVLVRAGTEEKTERQ